MSTTSRARLTVGLLLAGLLLAGLAPAAVQAAPAAPRVVLVVGPGRRPDGDLPPLGPGRGRGGAPLDDGRRRGLLPGRHLAAGAPGSPGRVGGRLPRPRQRLPQPLRRHVAARGPGRVRAEPGGRPRRRRAPVFRREGRCRAGPPGPGRGRPALPPVLRVGARRAGDCRGDRGHRPPAGRQLRRRLPRRRRVGRRRRRLRRSLPRTCGGCSGRVAPRARPGTAPPRRTATSGPTPATERRVPSPSWTRSGLRAASSAPSSSRPGRSGWCRRPPATARHPAARRPAHGSGFFRPSRRLRRMPSTSGRAPRHRPSKACRWREPRSGSACPWTCPRE